jgi:hypothetical protein
LSKSPYENPIPLIFLSPPGERIEVRGNVLPPFSPSFEKGGLGRIFLLF